ncbi:MAG: ABC transporter ATP-binding protein [Kiritimatiellia bacterium]
MSAVITARNIGKRYRLGEHLRHNTLRDALRGALHKTPSAEQEDFWALKDVSFDVQEGEVIGVIGRNGAGKSTLLKVLSQITEPTEGEVRIRGRVASLLEVGTGFHPELSGRENIFLNGAILGMTRREIKASFDAIVEFAGVGKFVDTPVKRYSSGMHVRLAFAVAAHLNPEILLVDEVLAVGDAAFQKKCMGKMGDVARSGRTILFVSHNMAAVEFLCSRTLLIDKGRMAGQGDTAEMIRRYLSEAVATSYDVDLSGHSARKPGSQPVLQRIRLTSADGATLQTAAMGADIRFELNLAPRQRLDGAVIGVHVYNSMGQRVMTCHTEYQYPERLNITRPVIAACTIRRLALMPGTYTVVLGVAAIGEQVDRIDPALSFDVHASDVYGTGRLPPARDGVFAPEAVWTVSSL